MRAWCRPRAKTRSATRRLARSRLDEGVDAGAELAREGVAAGRAVAGEALRLGDHQRLHARGRERGARVVHAAADVVVVVGEVDDDQPRAGLDAAHDLLPFG